MDSDLVRQAAREQALQLEGNGIAALLHSATFLMKTTACI
jgi:hypothetical protein